MRHTNLLNDASPRRRGRPPAYNADRALEEALKTFWQKGYAATTLDELAAATGMNRPSLYAAFGDKRALYLKALARYRDRVQQAFDRLIELDLPLQQALTRMFNSAIGLYRTSGPRGCFNISTAAPEALSDPEVRALFDQSIRRTDAALERLLRRAIARGEVSRDAPVAALARSLTATLHTLALRARAGQSRAQLNQVAADAVRFICGAPVEQGETVR